MQEGRKKRYWEKIEHFENYYNLLKTWTEEIEFGKYNGKRKLKNADYKNLFAYYHSAQLLIEAILDINAMIVKDVKNYAKDNYENLFVLQEENIISEKVLNHLRELTGLRNRIVHDYNGLIDTVALTTLKEKLHAVTTYKEQIIQWLNQNS